MTVTLFITPAENQPGKSLVVVSGEGFFNSVNKQVGARIRGEDPVFDDRLFSIGIPGISRVGVDGGFTLSKTVATSELNEDWGRDEIYALVDIEDFGGGSIKSNVIKRDF